MNEMNKYILINKHKELPEREEINLETVPFLWSPVL